MQILALVAAADRERHNVIDLKNALPRLAARVAAEELLRADLGVRAAVRGLALGLLPYTVGADVYFVIR